METTGQVSHTGTSDYPHYQGHSQGNGKVNAGSETRDLEQLHQAVLLFRAKRLIEGEQMH